jgi:hypothetical protein
LILSQINVYINVLHKISPSTCYKFTLLLNFRTSVKIIYAVSFLMSIYVIQATIMSYRFALSIPQGDNELRLNSMIAWVTYCFD